MENCMRGFCLQGKILDIVSICRDCWWLTSLFERSLQGSCPIAQSSEIHVIKAVDARSQLHPNPSSQVVNSGREVAVFDLKKETGSLNIGIVNEGPVKQIEIPTRFQNQLLVSRHLTGFGQERGGFLTKFHNMDPDNSIDAIFFESVPWFLKLYLHTLRFESENLGSAKANITVKSTSYQPAIDRIRPSALELLITIPPKTIVYMTMEFDIAFIKYTEHPPDANRGFDVSSSVVTVLDKKGRPTGRIFTENVLIALPTPDFSMPYNVITMTCTVMALFFGSLFNVITRQFIPVRIILLGDSAVGKSKLIERFLMNDYVPHQLSTYALTLYRHRTSHPTKPGTMINVDFWDTAGQERFQSMHPSYYISAHCCILCFDMTRKITYKNLDIWYEELVSHRGLGIPVVVVANKVDMDPSRAKKSFGFIERRREERGGGEDSVPFFLCSASDGTNVVAAFREAVKRAVQFKDSGEAGGTFVDDVLRFIEEEKANPRGIFASKEEDQNTASASREDIGTSHSSRASVFQ
ncbi:Rab-like protein 2A [Phlyctochytrium planicorne]|nr:Rab-like protein 2A [Phlyctochytrium planicorne]